MFVCSECGQAARDNYNLNRHKRKHVRFQCKLCDETFVCGEEEKAHKAVCGKYFTCFYCDSRVSDKDYLVRHIKKFHATTSNPIKPRRHDKPCPLCSRRFQFIDQVEWHLTSDHHKLLENQCLVFDTEDDFYEWKAKLESTTNSAFVQKGGVRRGIKTKRIYLYCFRSGFYETKPIESRKRLPRTLGSNKINAYCPARIFAKVLDSGKVEVTCVLTHLGHDSEVARLRFSESYRRSLAMKMKLKIPLEDIPAAEREQTKTTPLARGHFLTRKDLLTYIARGFGVNGDMILDENDATSVQAWVKNKMNAQSSLVQYHKFQGDTDPLYPELQDSDFILILMNDIQRVSLKEFGNKVICVDGTHGSNGYGFEMTTILVLNDRMEGIPVAFMFSSRSDTGIMNFFFHRIRDFSGQVKCQTFMSDITEIYFQAWVQVMGTPNRRLFCSWHIDRAWKKNLNKVKGGTSVRNEAYQKLKAVQIELDIPTFNIMFSNLLNDLLSDSNTEAFGEYIREYYSKNTENWAYCHRMHAGVNTNMHLERMHGVFKYLYLRGKKTKRLDKALHAVEAFTGDFNFFDEFISSHKGKVSKELRTIRRKHKIYLKERNKMQVTQANGNEWMVSSVTLTDLYTVSKKQESCERCSLSCGWCRACIHMYLCTCIDNAIKGNMCKHIHKVSSEYNVEPPCDEPNPSIVVERPNDIICPCTSETTNFQDVVEVSLCSETPPPSINPTRVEELSMKYINVLKKIKNEEQYATAQKVLSSLDATLSALEQMGAASKKPLPSPAKIDLRIRPYLHRRDLKEKKH